MKPAPSSVSSTEELEGYLRWRSRGMVVRALPSGPVFAGGVPPSRHPRPSSFVWAISGRARFAVAMLSVFWLVTLACFWIWWLRPEHWINPAAFVVNSILLAYVTTLPLYFLVATNRLRRLSPRLVVPDLRVAFVVTKAPSEPWPVARSTLTAMLAQDFPHAYDVWLCDEAPDEQTLQWCARHGVGVCSREGIDGYHRATWPRRRRCKEGNLTYFYDVVGYDDYDVVAQLDCDHVPSPAYLAEMVRAFADPAIGYVAAPSVCATNADASWAVRGRLYHEATFHGPHQLGHNVGLAPVAIGSHYAVRTAALAEIGGLGPELAEDFTTSYLFNVAGWVGAFAIDAPARGEGPSSFAAMVTQEFQWTRSLSTVLFTLVPRTLGRLPWRLRWRFVSSLSFYPLLVMTTAGGLGLIAVAASTGVAFARVNYLVFLAFWFAMGGLILALAGVLQVRKLLRPADAPLVSWEQWLFVVTKWPFNALGLFAALVQALVPRPVDFKVTPKGASETAPLPIRLISPFLVIVVILTASAIVGMRTTDQVGYIGLCLLGASTYALAAVAVPILHAYESAVAADAKPAHVIRSAALPVLISLVTIIPLVLAWVNYPGQLASAWGW